MTAKALFLAIVLFAGSAWAQAQDQLSHCTGWNRMNEGQRAAFVMGWVWGVDSANMLTKETIKPLLWPMGHRVGGVVIEIDLACERADNKNTDLSVIIMRIASEKNR
jgi:hypothetical protein